MINSLPSAIYINPDFANKSGLSHTQYLVEHPAEWYMNFCSQEKGDPRVRGGPSGPLASSSVRPPPAVVPQTELLPKARAALPVGQPGVQPRSRSPSLMCLMSWLFCMLWIISSRVSFSCSMADAASRKASTLNMGEPNKMSEIAVHLYSCPELFFF